MTRGSIGFIDDEPDLCEAARDWLESSGFDVATWTEPARAAAEIVPAQFDVLLIDLRMPDLPGDALLKMFRERDADLPVILMSAHADVPAAVAAMREGAHDFIEKPYLAEYLVAVLDRAVQWRRLKRDLAQTRGAQSRAARIEQELPGASPRILALREEVAQIADVPVDVLVSGEAGTGRAHLARLIHDLSRRGRRNFVTLDCAAVPDEALRAELFGYERGILPDRSGERHSRFEFANGGTIFLAGIEALSPALQAQLFRVLADRSVVRMGGQVARPVDIRLIASAAPDLRRRMEDGRFRADLYFRLAGAELRMPALSERPDDIPALYLHLLEQAARRFRRPVPDPSPNELAAIRARAWPGNLAQLTAAAERQVLGLRAGIPSPAAGEAGDDIGDDAENDIGPLPRRVAAFEARAIAETLARCGGSSAAAARRLGIPRRTLNEKIARYGLRGDG